MGWILELRMMNMNTVFRHASSNYRICSTNCSSYTLKKKRVPNWWERLIWVLILLEKNTIIYQIW